MPKKRLSGTEPPLGNRSVTLRDVGTCAESATISYTPAAHDVRAAHYLGESRSRRDFLGDFSQMVGGAARLRSDVRQRQRETTQRIPAQNASSATVTVSACRRVSSTDSRSGDASVCTS